MSRIPRIVAAARRLLAAGMAALVLVLVVPGVSLAQQRGFYHTVQRGETLDGLARRFRVSSYDLAKTNHIGVSSKLTAGSKLFIPSAGSPAPTKTSVSSSTKPKPSSSSSSRPKSATPSSTVTIRVQEGDSLWKIANRFGISIADLARANGLGTNSSLKKGQSLRVPSKGPLSSSSPSGGSSVVIKQADKDPSPSEPVASPPPRQTGSPAASSRQGFRWPLDGQVIRGFESGSSRKHFGMDISAPEGSPVHAAKDGTVAYAGSTISAYGNMVIIEHPGGYATCYAYCKKLLVSANQKVRQGDVIGQAGSSTKLAEPGIHFQIRKNGDAVNPEPYLP